MAQLVAQIAHTYEDAGSSPVGPTIKIKNMEYTRQFTIIQLDTKRVNNNIQVVLEYGKIDDPYYNEGYPQALFDTEDDAIKYAYKKEPYATWIIVPIINFKNK